MTLPQLGLRSRSRALSLQCMLASSCTTQRLKLGMSLTGPKYANASANTTYLVDSAMAVDDLPDMPRTSAGGSRVSVRLKALDHMDPDMRAAEALASGQPEDIGSYFAGDR